MTDTPTIGRGPRERAPTREHVISDPHPTRHINHSSEPVMVQPSPDTAQVLVRKAQCAYVCSRSIARARENWTSTVRFIDTG